MTTKASTDRRTAVSRHDECRQMPSVEQTEDEVSERRRASRSLQGEPRQPSSSPTTTTKITKSKIDNVPIWIDDDAPSGMNRRP